MIENTRMERDTFGKIAAPNERLWEAHTQRSLQNFQISSEAQPPEFIHALALICTDRSQEYAEMKLDATTFRQLRRLAPVLDDVLNAGEVEYPHQAVNLAALAALCSQLFQTYELREPVGMKQARVDAK